MKYSICSDIMYVRVGKTGPLWAKTEELIESMDFAKKNGIDIIEFFDWESRDLDMMAQAAKEKGISILSIVAKNGGMLGNPSTHEAFLNGLLESFSAANKVGAKAVVVGCGGAGKELGREETLALIADGLKEAATLAEKAGVEIWLEAVTGGFFKCSKEVFDAVRAADSPWVKVLYDIYHFQMMEGNICNTIKENIDLIGHIHGAGAPQRCELTVGELNYEYILQFIKDLGYEGTFGLEFFTFTDRDRKVADSCRILV